jgi:hypothetical protein
VQGTAFAAETAKIGRVFWIATYAHYLLAIALYQHTATHAAVTTGGFGFNHLQALGDLPRTAFLD